MDLCGKISVLLYCLSKTEPKALGHSPYWAGLSFRDRTEVSVRQVAFRRFDTDNSGFITAASAEDACHMLGD